MGHALAVSDWIVNNMQLGRGREGPHRPGPARHGPARGPSLTGPAGKGTFLLGDLSERNRRTGTFRKERRKRNSPSRTFFPCPQSPGFPKPLVRGGPLFPLFPAIAPILRQGPAPSDGGVAAGGHAGRPPELLIRTRCGAMRANQRPRSGLRSEGGRTLGKRRRRPDGTKRGSSPLARGKRFSLSQRGGTFKKG